MFANIHLHCTTRTLDDDLQSELAGNVESLGVKPNGTPVDPSTRPDLLARVFYLKLKRLIADIKGRPSSPGCFGKLKNFVYTVEYQKRGLFSMRLRLACNYLG